MPLRRLPALGSLRAFEAAGRLSSFKAAAAELAVTPGAVSQQIRGLEEDLGVKLFTRAVRSVTLTEAGQKLQPALTTAFLQIKDAVDDVRPRGAQPLRVSASGPVISKWLLPRLHRFSERYPDLGVTISGGDELRDCEPGEVFIRFNDTPGTNAFCHKLCDEFLVPLASPELVERLNLRKPADLLRAPLLHHLSDPQFAQAPDWPAWFVAAGMDPANARHGMRFDPRSADHAIDAAVNGAGVVLGRWFLARSDMVEGRLVMPFGPILPMNVSYYILCRSGAERSPDIAAFINWIREESAASADGACLSYASG